MTVAARAAAAPQDGAAAAETRPDHRHLDVAAVSKRFGRTDVVKALDFAVARGELASLLGPSGCGKTTLLRLVAGLEDVDDGAIAIGGRDVTRTPAHRRNVSVVFQNYALFPHLSVAENVAFGLKARGRPRASIAPKVAEALALVRMSDFADRPTSALSGGQQQRVAVARALAVDPDLLLLDEPFSALDRKLRETMQVELKRLLRDRGVTAVFVTHDQDEALALSDRIAVMNAGRIEQVAPPQDLYAAPATAFVMDFVGLSTRLSGRVVAASGGELEIDTAMGRLRGPGALALGAAVVVGVRPERVTLGPGAVDANAVATPVAEVMCVGSRIHIHGAAGDGDRLLCELPAGAPLPVIGAETRFGWAVADTLVRPA